MLTTLGVAAVIPYLASVRIVVSARNRNRTALVASAASALDYDAALVALAIMTSARWHSEHVRMWIPAGIKNVHENAAIRREIGCPLSNSEDPRVAEVGVFEVRCM